MKQPRLLSFRKPQGECPRKHWFVHSGPLSSNKAFHVEKLAGATGLEPAASCVTGRRSNQLNYAPAYYVVSFLPFPPMPSHSLPYHLAVP